MTAPAVEFVNVSREYSLGSWSRRHIRAVDEVSLRIEPGEVFGLLGPNRAGKTTLVKMLLSLCHPSDGDIVRLGSPVSDRRTLAKVGYMHENHAFPRYLNARELLSLYGALTLIPYEKLSARVEELLVKVGIADRAADPVSGYSKGMVQRVGLAQALLNDPELLVLDEPTEGLDLAGRKLLREVVDELRRRQRTVLIVSHVLQEIEQLCDRVGVIRQGKLVFVGKVSDLTRSAESGTSRSLEQALQELYDA